MAGYDRDEAPMLSDTHSTLVDESLDSQSQAYMSRTRSMSISIPTSSMDGDMNRHDKVDENRKKKKIFAIWKKIFVICCLVAIFLDPLFFFLLSIQQDHLCIVIHRNMTITIVAFRSLTDFVFLLNRFGCLPNRLLEFWHMESRVGHPRRTTQNYLNHLVDLFVVLPLPQIMVLSVLPKYLREGAKSSGANLAKDLIITAVLIQYIPRLFRFLPLHVGLILETAWAIFFKNLSTFVLSGHVIGSWWYLFGLQRVGHCLFDACVDTGFGKDTCLQFIKCGVENSGNEFGSDPNWISWRMNENATACFSGDSFEYGIFKQAAKLTTKDITTRYVFSVFWGFQQISTLAGNLQPSYFVWEVLFNMLIIGLGLLLFALLIGNMQYFLQALYRRKLEFSLRQRDLKQWMRRRSLPKQLKKRVKAAEKYKWAATRGVNEGILIENLPEDIQKEIRRHMFEFVKKLKVVGKAMDQHILNRHILDAICERLKQTIYIEGSEILYAGGVVDKMVFIKDGKLISIGDGTKTLLSEGSVCGEELLPWFLEHASVSKDGKKIKVIGQRLLSNRTVRCLSNVEAFSLRAEDLEEVTDHFASLTKTEKLTTMPRARSI